MDSNRGVVNVNGFAREWFCMFRKGLRQWHRQRLRRISDRFRDFYANLKAPPPSAGGEPGTVPIYLILAQMFPLWGQKIEEPPVNCTPEVRQRN